MNNASEVHHLPQSRSGLAAATDARSLTWRVQVIILFGFFVLALVSSVVFQGTIAPIALVVAAVAWAAQWGALWLAHRMFLTRQWWRRHGFMSSLILLVIIGVLAIITSVIAGSAAVTDGWTVIWRWVITLLVSAVAVLSVEYRRDLEYQRELREELLQAKSAGIEQVMSQRFAVVTRMLQMLQDSVATATNHSESASRAVSQFARDRVRPLSHELMVALPVVDVPRSDPTRIAGWREALERITAVPLVRPWLMAIAVTVLFVFTTVQTTSSSSDVQVRDASDATGVTVTVDLGSLLMSFLLLALVFATTLVTSWVMLRATRGVLPRLSLGRRLLVALLTPIVIAVLVQLVIQIAYVVPGFSRNLSSNLVDRLWLTVPIVVVAFALLIIRVLTEAITSTRRDLQRSTADLSWENSRLRNSLGQERKFYSTQLHGPIQSAAVAAAMRLESFDDSDDVAPVLENVERDLTRAIHSLADGPPERRDVRAEVANLGNTWAGVCDVVWDVPDSLLDAMDADWVAAGTMMDVLVDAVANAAMHGRAKHVWISVRWTNDDEVGITVTNDGSTDLGESRGLGSVLLDESCVQWSRKISDGRVVLTFTLAIPRVGVGASVFASK